MTFVRFNTKKNTQNTVTVTFVTRNDVRGQRSWNSLPRRGAVSEGIGNGRGDGGGGVGSLRWRRGPLGASWYSNQSPVDGIGGEPEALEGVHPQNRLRAGLGEHGNGRLGSVADPYSVSRARGSRD